jgi:CheY-like chemotaxis protein
MTSIRLAGQSPLHILLADDDAGDRLLFTEAFRELKINALVQTVKGGIELMELLTMKDARLPYLLFLDLNMPIKSGFECLKEIRSNEKLKEIYIAIYSTSAAEKDIQETFLNGANIYITKPGDFNLLVQVLEKAVNTVFLYQQGAFNRENFLLRI